MKKAENKTPLHFAVVSTDVVCFKIIDSTLHVLLVKVEHNPYFLNMFAVVGGLVHADEQASEASDRLLLSKAGISRVYKEQLYTFDRVDRDPRGRVVAVAHLAIAQNAYEDTSLTDTVTHWQSIKKIPTLAYDHNEIVSVALARLRSRMSYTNIAQHFLPKEFTLSELQTVYEIVFGKPLDRRNFRKKILAGSFLKDTGRTRKVGVMRPASLYSFTSSKIELAEML